MEQTFSFCRKQFRLLLTMGGFFTLLGVFGLIIYAFRDDGFAKAFLVLSPPALIPGTWLVLSALLSPTYGVSLDDEGIWMTRRGRDKGLIRWHDVHETKERHVLSRLDLLDEHGRTLLRLRNSLHGFDRLAKIVQTRVRQTSPGA